MSMYIETNKPKSLADATEPLYYMFSNRHDSLGESYMEITNDEVLEISYRVYRKEK